jgi:hypothetical protein
VLSCDGSLFDGSVISLCRWAASFKDLKKRNLSKISLAILDDEVTAGDQELCKTERAMNILKVSAFIEAIFTSD